MLSNLTTYQKLLLLKKTAGGGVRVVTKKLKGNAPLSFTAVAKPLVSLIQYGKTEQNGTPTPSAPVDIVCNNGTLKMRHRSGLPLGYTLLDYVEANGTQYIDLDVSGNATFIGTAQSTTNSPTTSQVLVANSGASAGHWFGVQSPGAGSAFAKRWGLGATATASSTIDGTTKVDFEITFTQTLQTGTVNDQTLTRQSSAITHTDWVAFAGNTTPSYGFIGKVWELKVAQNDVLVHNLIPAKNASNFVGMYDLVSGRFFTSLGAGDFVEGDPVSDPVEFYIDGTPEVLSVGGLNIFYNDEEWERGFYLTSGKVASAPANRTFVMRCTPNTTYYWKHCSLVGGIRAFTVDEDEVAVGVKGTWIKQNPVVGEINEVYSATTGANAKWICVCFGRNQSGAAPIADQWSDFMLSVSPLTAETPYEPCRTPQTASVQNLFAVGDYADTQNIISGAITRKVGVKVFDGTEAFTLSGTAFRTLALSDKAVNTKVICSHFNGDVEPTMAVSTMPDLSVKGYGPNEVVFFKYSAITTVADFKAWLADQYAAGTPVIVLYPLADETTETVSPQALSTEQGVNTIQVDAEVSPIELEVSYKDKQ